MNWDLLYILARDMIWSAVAAVGFALVFNVPRRVLWGCALGGALGHGVRTLLVSNGVVFVPAQLAGAAVIGFTGSYLAKRWRIPSNVITVSSAIPLVPGVFAFQAMIGILEVAATPPTSPLLLQARIVTAALNGINTALLLGCIAVGIAAPALIFKREKPVV